MRQLATLFCLFALSLSVSAEPLVGAEDPWVREAPPGTRVTAAYLTLQNPSEETVTLVSVSAEEYARVELHETVHEDDQARMRKIDELEIPAEGQVSLEPGGKHLMLHDPHQTLEAGDWVTLTLEFDSGQLLEVTARMRQRTGREDEDD